MSDEDVNRNINESADKIRMDTKLTRGTGTGDRDKVNVNVRGNEPAEVASDLVESVRELEETAVIARSIQPEATEEIVVEFDPESGYVGVYDENGEVITEDVGEWDREDGADYLTLEVVRDD